MTLSTSPDFMANRTSAVPLKPLTTLTWPPKISFKSIALCCIAVLGVAPMTIGLPPLMKSSILPMPGLRVTAMTYLKVSGAPI